MRQLQLIILVANMGSIHKAANVAAMTQSSATKAIAEIESIIETPLFERHARGARPTLACKDLLPLLRSMLQSLHQCAESLSASHAGVQGIVRVGAISPGITGLLGSALPAFLSGHQHVRIDLVEETQSGLVSRFADHTLDLIVARAPADLVADWRFIPLRPDQSIVLAHKKHPLAVAGPLKPKQLIDYPWVQAPLDSLTHQSVLKLFSGCGRLPQCTPLTSRSLPATVMYILNQPQTLMMAPRSYVQPFLDCDALTSLDVPHDDTLPPIGMLVRDEPRNTGLAALRDFLQAQACM